MSTEDQTSNGGGVATAADTLTITDNRTGKTYEVPIEDGTVRAIALRDIKVADDDFGLMTYDPAFMNTASCRSAITYIDGEQGSSSTAAIRSSSSPSSRPTSRSPTCSSTASCRPRRSSTSGRTRSRSTRSSTRTSRASCRASATTRTRWGCCSRRSAPSRPSIPTRTQIDDAEIRYLQIVRLIAKMPTLAAFAFRHAMGQPYVYPDNDLRYPGNFLGMLYKMTELKYQPDPRLERALDILFILHADHEQNCSTNAVRSVGSSQVDPYSAVAAGVAALYGPLHGGANEAVLRMLRRIGSKDNIPDFIKGVKDGDERLMGFGHRVYKNYDPRAKIIKSATDDVFEVTGTNPLLEIALELERIALEDDYFVKRKLYPNVDFYSGLIYEALGMPVGMFPVLFAIPRTSGWIAQWLEMIDDKEQKIARPRQIYTGDRERDYVPIGER